MSCELGCRSGAKEVTKAAQDLLTVRNVWVDEPSSIILQLHAHATKVLPVPRVALPLQKMGAKDGTYSSATGEAVGKG